MEEAPSSPSRRPGQLHSINEGSLVVAHIRTGAKCEGGELSKNGFIMVLSFPR
jgi:hypothetical protein